MNKLSPLPKVGKYYHFWDDGKTGPMRHYICRVERIIPRDESFNITVESMDLFDETNHGNVQLSLYAAWRGNVEDCHFLFADETDYFIEISCPTYDDNLLYAVRTKDGRWFTLDIQSSWQGGMLDVDGKIMKGIKDYYKNSEWPEFVKKYCKATEKNYNKDNEGNN